MKRILKKYKETGFKLTPQRLAILKFLEGNTGHPTAENIFNAIRKAHPTISFATVYNTIQALKDRGEIFELTIDPERKHYDPNVEPHHHVVCTGCNKIGDVFADFTDVLRLPDEVIGDFSVSANHVNFYGVCTDCSS